MLTSLLALLCLPAAAQAAADPKCSAQSSLAEPLEAVVRDAARWNCSAPLSDIAAQRSLVSLPVASGETPTHALFRRGTVAGIHVLELSGEQILSRRSYTLDDAKTVGIDAKIAIALPSVSGEVDRIVLAFDLPTNVAQINGAYLKAGDPQLDPGLERGRLMVAIICGMLLMPMVFNLAFWRVLRQRFLIWHIISAATMICSIMFSSGLATWLLGISTNVLSIGASLFFGLMVGAATYFAYHFIEPGKLDPRLRRALPWAAGAAALLSTLHAFFPYVWRDVQLKLYMAAYAPILAVKIAVVTDAIRRGSRAALYQAVGWGPLLVCGVIRQVSYLTPGLAAADAMALFYFGCAFEVLATAMGVADRLMHLKRQRDNALGEVRELVDLTQRDALTGLLNRRAVQRRFHDLRRDGFTTMAVLDLDKFKDINDTYGHARGDEVLTVVASALQEDEDTIAVRMGGEEFMLLLRGKDAAGRAELRRLAITVEVADRVLLDRQVTCSMGLVEAPGGAEQFLDFDALYERADKLLYEAKATGRNRTVSERLQLFHGRRATDAPPVAA